MWRIKKCRAIELDIKGMSCHCFGPTDLDCEEIKLLQQDILQPDELQSLIYQDIDGLTMDQASTKMWVSKTVYAGIYKCARIKVTTMLIQGSILKVCTKCDS